MPALTIGDRSRDGLLEITDTAWDSNGGMRVTVRELYGLGNPEDLSHNGLRRMRRLARRALSHPELTKSSRELRRFMEPGGSVSVTFLVSRNERY